MRLWNSRVCRSTSGLLAPVAVVLALSAAARAAPPTFTDVAAEAGIRFRHRAGRTVDKNMIETLGAGVCFLDYNGDRRPDLYFVQSGPVPGRPGTRVGNVLYRNDGAGKFTDVSEASGTDDDGYGMGCAAADVDNDGDLDLYVTNFGDNVLYRNDGDGTFTKVPGAGGAGNRLWSASAAFGDYDGDGYVDLYVTNYVDFTLENNKLCGDHSRRLRAYCHPDAYEGLPDALYRNNGDGTFTDVTVQAGLTGRFGKGLGVLWTDLDDDGDVDLYVANDSVPNVLYRNDGDGTFTDVTLLSGAGYSEDGMPEAGMGVDAGDYDGDGRFDLVVTNLSGEVNELYRNAGGLLFDVQTFPAGFGEASLAFVGFGIAFLDYDNDADADLLVVNGHIIDNISLFNDAYTYPQRDFLFENRGGGKLREVGRQHGSYFEKRNVGRGLALADYDGDGDLDAAISNNDQRAVLLRNDGGNAGSWLRLRLHGSRSNRDGLGALVRVTAGGRTQVRELRSGASYCSQSELVLHLGLGTADTVSLVEVRWPAGGVQRLTEVGTGQVLEIRESAGDKKKPGADDAAPGPSS